MKQSKPLAAAFVAAGMLFLAGCSNAETVNNNISEAADKFQVTRQLTVINGITDKVLFQMDGNFSINDQGNQLEITAKLPEEMGGGFRKHMVGLSDNVTYVVEDLSNTKGADAPFYHVFYLPGEVVHVEVAK